MDPFYEDYVSATNKKDIKIYRYDDSNLCCTITIRHNTKFHEISKSLQQKWDTYFNRLRLFNQEGVEITEDDLDYIKNGTVLFASKEYELLQDIGEGGFDKVLLGRHKQTGEKVEIKIVKQTLSNAQDDDMSFREALKHDTLNLNKDLEEITNGSVTQQRFMMHTFYKICKRCGQLLQYLQTKGKFEESEARHYFKQLVSAVSYCHQKKTIHGDLKLENLLLTSKYTGVIKCIGLGVSGFIQNNTPEKADAGSLRYMAPELLKGMDKAVSLLVDVWSMGIILYGMLFGTLPFNGNTKKEIITQISEAGLMIPTDFNTKLSQNFQDCLQRTLEPDPKKRITSIELLNHPFVTNETLLELISNLILLLFIICNNHLLSQELQYFEVLKLAVISFFFSLLTIPPSRNCNNKSYSINKWFSSICVQVSLLQCCSHILLLCINNYLNPSGILVFTFFFIINSRKQLGELLGILNSCFNNILFIQFNFNLSEIQYKSQGLKLKPNQNKLKKKKILQINKFNQL